MRRFLCGLAMLAALALGAAPAGAAPAPNYTGLWWKSTEAGWGVNISHQGDTMSVGWFTYDAAGDATWFYMFGNMSSPNVFIAMVTQPSGSPYNAPWDPNAFTLASLGTGTLTFTDSNNATLAYTVNGITQSKALTRQVFSSPVPTCVWNAQPAPFLYAVNYQGTWFTPNEVGWMARFAHQGDTLFATLHIYDLDGSALFLVMSNGTRSGNAYSGSLYRTTGPAFSANPWNPSALGATHVGNMTVTFINGDGATLAYSVNGASVTKSITRSVYAANGTTCGYAPGAPAIGSVTSGNGQATVSFTAPASDGGFPITDYIVTTSPGGIVASGGTSPITVTGLANGTAYTFTVKAVNVVNPGAASAPSSVVTPAAPPLRPNDFNADGHPDLIWSNTANGSTYLWYMNGPTLATDAFITQIDPSWKIQGVADFNGDGHPDLVWRNTATGSTFVWYMNFTTFVSDAPLFTLPPEWVIQGVADFNADGKPDFLMRNTVSGNAFVWFFNDATPIGDEFLFSIDPEWKVEAVAELNFDGQPDLLFRNMSSGLAFAWATAWSGTSLTLADSSPPIFGIDPVWEIVQVDDWNADANKDLVFRNRDTGLVFVWYMTGITLGASDFITQIDPSWEIVPRR